jgi:serine/threonine-protein kinase
VDLVGADLIGAVLDGRYRVVERVAEGAMGVVYRGERIKLGRSVAIKFLHGWSAADAAARKRFEVEAKAMARLEHPHCAAVIDVGEHEGAPYVVMDYVRGATLREILDEGALAVPRAAEIMKQILSGLAHAHELEIIHRDIKPANIMVGDQVGLGETVKILDFGLARLRGSPGGLTVGIAVGTPSYMAPEQIVGGAVDARTDLYSCGILLFEMLTGEKPYAAEEPIEVLRLHREAPVPAASSLATESMREDVRVLDDVVGRAMQKRPEDRFASAAEFARAIDDAVRARVRAAEQLSVARPPRDIAAQPIRAESPQDRAAAVERPRPASRRNLVIAAAVLGGLAAIGVIAMVASGGSGGSDQPAPSTAQPVVTRVAPPDAPDPSDDVLARAQALAGAGSADEAIALLGAGRKTFPDRAALSFELGKLYFARFWWRDGLEAFREAIRVDPAYRADPDLIKTVLRGFITTPDTDDGLARFLLVDVGSDAIPYLQETAQSHPSQKVRARAAALLGRYH